MLRYSVFIIWFYLILGSVQAQVNLGKPGLTIVQDSIMLGEPMHAILRFEHHKNLEVKFPDSTGNFTPFEYYSRKAYSTVTSDSISMDCTVYVLQAFELDPTQVLQLEVDIYLGKDTIKLVTNQDTVFLKEVIQQMPDSIKLHSNTEFTNVESEVNYPVLTLVSGTLFLIGVVLLVVFGKRIVIKIKVYRIGKRHEKFEKEFDLLATDDKQLENLVKLWKHYLGTLEKKDIASMTTREIGEEFGDQEVKAILKAIDGFVFGGIPVAPEQNLDALRVFAKSRVSLSIALLQQRKAKEVVNEASDQ